MPTRTRRNWKPDSRGYYSRQIGWEHSKSGKLQQHKFILGTDRKDAERRDQRLRELWEQFESSSQQERPLWPRDLLAIAKQVAKGHTEVTLTRYGDEQPEDYAYRLKFLQTKCPVAILKPDDEQVYETGCEQLGQYKSQLARMLSLAESMMLPALSFEHVSDSMRDFSDRIDPAGSTGVALTVQPMPPQEGVAPLHGSPQGSTANVAQENAHVRNPTLGVTLHKAFEAYKLYLRKEYHNSETDQITDWGNTQLSRVKTLQMRHDDISLQSLDAAAIVELIGYWRRRPCKQGTDKPMTPTSCGNYLNTLTRFLKWLDSSCDFDWRKPIALSDIDTRVRRLSSDHAKKSLAQVDTFSVDELKLIMRYGQPLDRLLLLLALNCGYGNAEISSLLIGEIHLFNGHSEQDIELLHYRTTDQDSFIKRVRRKSGVYGEHILFPMTVQGLQWALQVRSQFPNDSREARLLLNENGKAFDTPTKSGNRNQGIANHFDRLIKRIQDDGNEIRPLSFGKLRKTAGNLIRLHSDGEVMGVFDCHGKPVKSDSLSDQYSNRPFGRVFQAIRDRGDVPCPRILRGRPRSLCAAGGRLTRRDRQLIAS